VADWASPSARRIRAEVFGTFAREGRPPSPEELSAKLGIDRAEVLGGLRELHQVHAVVLAPEGDAIRMAHPFSAWPMNFVVSAPEDDRLWWGGCAWDSFGIVAALGEPLEVLTHCPGCGAELRYAAGPQEPPDLPGLVVRIPRPAADWWEDVVETCSSIRAFCSHEHAERWIARSGSREGDVVDAERLWALALPWYGDRLDSDWAPRPVDRSQAILEDAGFAGPFWELPR